MMFETGRVVAVERDSLWVETVRQSTCGNCVVRKSCGHSLINGMSDGRRSYIRVLPGEHDLADCAVNDQVRIGIPESTILRGSAVVYIVPLLAMLSGAFAAASLRQGDQDLIAVAGALGGFILGLVAVRWHAWRHRGDAGFQPTLVEIFRTASQPPVPG